MKIVGSFLRLFVNGKALVIMLLLLMEITMAAGENRTDSIFVSQYSIEEGLRQSMVKQVYADSFGLLWMVTGDGLHLFDGLNFRIFRTQNLPSFIQSDNVMRSIMEIVPGKFILSSSSSLLYFDSYTSKFRTVIHKQGLFPELFSQKLNNMPLVWTFDAGYSLFERDTLFPIEIDFGEQTKFAPRQLVMVDSTKYLMRRSDGVFEITSIPTRKAKFKAKRIEIDGVCIDLITDARGKVYALVDSKVLVYNEHGLFEEYFDTAIEGINSAFIDSHNIIWLSRAAHREIYRIVNGVLEKVNLFVRDGKFVKKINPYTINFFEDRQKNLWIGTDGDGVIKYQKQQVIFGKYKLGFVRCIESIKNEIWVGTFKNGLWKLSDNLGSGKRMKPDTYNNLVDILDLSHDQYNRLWIASRNGVDVIDDAGNCIFHQPMNIDVAKFYPYEGNILLSTGNELIYFDPSPNPSKKATHTFYHISSWISYQGCDWLGTSKGLFRLKTGTPFNLDQFEQNCLSTDNRVQDMLVSKNKLWLAGNQGLKIFTLDGKNDTIPKAIDHLRNEIIYSLMEDEAGRIWFSSNSGIACITEGIDRVIYFNASNNLQSLEFNSNAKCISSEGVFYFGGINGINRINPNSFVTVSDKSKPLIVSLTLSDTLYSHGITPSVSAVRLNWRESNISGTVATTNYFRTSDQKYSFLLENLDISWSQPSSNQSFSYRNIPSGKYVLKAKYLDFYQNWSEPIQLLRITIEPPIWKRIWFIVLIILFVIFTTVYIVIRVQGIRYRNRIKQLEYQNALEKERMRISRDLHDELGSGLSLIMLNSSMAMNDNGNHVKKYLDTISRNSRELYVNMNHLIWLLKTENQTFENLFARLHEKISEILEEAEFKFTIVKTDECNNWMIRREACRDIFLIVKESVNNAIKHSKGTTVNIKITSGGENLLISISDDGIGLNENRKNYGGNGFTNMIMRTRGLGGTFEIQTNGSIGSVIKVCIPFEQLVVR